MASPEKHSPENPVLACPRCQAPVIWSTASPYRPFCSERCKLIDLGAWADESHRIPGEEVHSSLNDETR